MNALALACSAVDLILAFAVRTAVQRRTGWTGCHLHFEMWDAPGWHEGGDSFDLRPALGGWDATAEPWRGVGASRRSVAWTT